MRNEPRITTDEKPYFKHVILWSVFLLLAITAIISSFIEIDIVTKGEGKVIPSQQVQTIQNLEGGIVKKILVQEGQFVNKNQILMYLDDTAYLSQYREAELKALALQARAERLTAQIIHKPFVPTPDLQKKAPELVQLEQSLYSAKESELQNLTRRASLLQEEINMTKPLVSEGVISRAELLRLQRDLGEINGNISSFMSTAIDELNKAQDELGQTRENMIALKDRLSRTVIVSPVHGIIKQLHVATVGGVVKPGEDIIEIVPLDDTLRIEARVMPADIGFISVGQPASVKITAYDYTIYGGLQGRVEHISADTIKDDKGNSYYEVWVRTNRNYLESRTKRLYIMPGMTATIDVLTGKRSLLQYFLKPLLKVKESAFRER